MNTNDLDTGVRRVVDDLTSYYLIGYTSTNPKPDGGFRWILADVILALLAADDDAIGQSPDGMQKVITAIRVTR